MYKNRQIHKLIKAPPAFEPAPQYKVSMTQTTIHRFGMKEKAQNIINQEAIELVEEPSKPENKLKARGVKTKGPSP